MNFDEDDEILQDFLVEAGEILEDLSGLLVELENHPSSEDLLNAIFRGFHTIKGGAGFLQLDCMVECCHLSESIFDLLRNGQRQVSAPLMDTILMALDSVNTMFDQLRGGEELTPANGEVLEQLASLARVETVETEEAPPALSETTDVVQETSGTVAARTASESPETVAEAQDGPPNESPSAADSVEISEHEFEALLDELEAQKKADQDVGATAVEGEPPADSGTDEITQAEFEALLDELESDKAKAEEADAYPETTRTQKNEAGPSTAPRSGGRETHLQASEKTGTKALESIVSRSSKKDGSPSGQVSVRVDTKRLDDIMNMVGELVLVRNRLVRLGLRSANDDMNKAVATLDLVTADLQASVMRTRMQPIKKVFGRFPRVVRDMARNLKKEISLEMHGEETDLDKNLVEALADPLVHLVRNSVDHGIELPQQREEQGKARSGTITLSAAQEGDHILLTIEDDGKGMDPEKLKQSAVNKGLLDQDMADRMSDTEACNLIFAPGFTTKDEISDVSGRGVGMDVVRTKINQLNGSVEVQSELGKGCSIRIKVPLTLAIMPTLMVMLGNQTFALPLVSVNEIYHLDLSETNVVDGQEVMVVRDKAIPLYHLKRWLVADQSEEQETEATTSHVVIVSIGTERAGFVVDRLIGQEEVVIKPLGAMLHGMPGMAGATITGDGTIALILDVPSMLKRYA